MALKLSAALVLAEPCFIRLRTFNQGQRDAGPALFALSADVSPWRLVGRPPPRLLSYLCRLTGHYKERPHLYIRDPLDSIVLEVQVGPAAGAGVRGPLGSWVCCPACSETQGPAAPHSLRCRSELSVWERKSGSCEVCCSLQRLEAGSWLLHSHAAKLLPSWRGRRWGSREGWLQAADEPCAHRPTMPGATAP